MQKPSIGRIVHYTLSEQDASAIVSARSIRQGVQGNPVKAGDVYPAVIVRVWDIEGSQPSCNLQVFLDGPDSFWALSRFQFGSQKELLDPKRESSWDWPSKV